MIDMSTFEEYFKKYLLKNIKANGWEKKVEVFPVAVGDAADVLDIWGGGTGASLIKGWANIPAYHVTQVPILTLDRIVGKEIQEKKALIVVDIEGAEYEALLGSTQFLKKYSPIVICEISINHNVISCKRSIGNFIPYIISSKC